MRERAIYISLPLPLLRRLVPGRPAVLSQAGRDELQRQVGFVAIGLHFVIAGVPRRLHRPLVGFFGVLGVVDDARVDVDAPLDDRSVGAWASELHLVAV